MSYGTIYRLQNYIFFQLSQPDYLFQFNIKQIEKLIKMF